ncbi:MAG: D-tyrosyl-tRNA(Tyr) deacylase, partial [Dehalococcoidia bacterium]|nr:D-tyrosyl-tRNA(Tyr) deacylase [Dehalococcoidia bacterium]
RASVSVEGKQVGAIGRGLAVLLGVAEGDGGDDAAWMARKIPELRIFNDAEGKFNLSLADVGGSVLLVSQFTLLGDARKGRRPSFVSAARPEVAGPLVDEVARLLGEAGHLVALGRFGAQMLVATENDGPVTIILDSGDRQQGG